MGGGGGTNAGIATEANLNAARTRNSGGENAILDQASRNMGKQNAAMSEGVASKSADLAQQHQQEAASGLAGLGQTDTNAQMKAMGLVPEDVNAEVGANNSGWFQNMNEMLRTISQAGGSLSKGMAGGG